MPKLSYKLSMRKLRKVCRNLSKKGWIKIGDSYMSPYTKIDYSFEDACKIENLLVPSIKPGDLLYRWVFF